MTDEWETVNQASALWTRPKKDITPEQYAEFYKQISHDYEAPLAERHNRVEGSTEYTQLLYIPAKAPMDLWNRDKAAGVKLYVKRVFIMDDAEALLPTYLRFVKGVVDSADLPLNVSRELLQESRDVKAIREGCTKRVLSMLEDLAKTRTSRKKTGKYASSTPSSAPCSRKAWAKTSPTATAWPSCCALPLAPPTRSACRLADYKARMKEGQEAIYYITADTLAAAKNSPQLEVFKKKGIEVLLMTDRVDEWALNYLHDFDGTPLQCVAKGAVDLGKLQDEAEKKAAEEAAEAFKPVLDKLKEALKDKAAGRARDHAPGRFTGLPGGAGRRHEHAAGAHAQAGRPDGARSQAGAGSQRRAPAGEEARRQRHFDDLAHILFDQALLAEGGLPEDPAAYVSRVNALLVLKAPAGLPLGWKKGPSGPFFMIKSASCAGLVCVSSY